MILMDNGGHRVPPHVGMADPVAASGQTLTNGTKDTDTEVTVVAGATYAVTSQVTGGFYFGVATVATAANILWACPIYRTILITIPLGVTTLHYATDVNSGVGYLRKLAE
jgi:hypothetical protein